MPDKLKAFVISPIGEPGSTARRHANWVLNEVIRKACERATAGKIEVVRSDESTLPGPIMGQVVASIVKDRVIFAVLSGDRPNVYYELALAIAAGRPVIILRDEDEQTQFDIQDFRAITYRYPEDEAPAPEAKIAEVAKFVDAVLQEEPYAPKVFSDLDALAGNYRDYQFKERFRDIDMASYSAVFNAATSFIGLQGISLRHFTTQFLWNSPKGNEVTFFELIRAKVLFDAVSVHIVLMHPDNPALPYLFKFTDRPGFSKGLANAREDIRVAMREWSELQQELDAKAPERADGRKGSLRVTQLMHGVVNYRLTLTDRQAVLSPYFNIFPYNSAGPALVCSRTTIIYDRLNKEFFDRIVSEERAAAALQEHGSLEIAAPTRAAE